MAPIFSIDFLYNYLLDFRLSSIINVRGKVQIIQSLIEELESGKIQSLKEEEIKSRFVNSFFGDVLDFNYGNSSQWLLREEKKSTIDGTKPDAALGYFLADKTGDDVRALIEIKDANTDLDTKHRNGSYSPVQQAFEYVAKMGGNCKWVIVSNIKEIRFYPSLDRSKCQIFLLKDLVNENRLKELFFLFHKDKFIKKNEKSSTDKLFELSKKIIPKTDKPIHIIDKIYDSLKRFEGFGFVDPNYIAVIKPFNILNDHVWHYDNRNLFTINEEIYELLRHIDIKDKEVILTDELKENLVSSNVIEPIEKIKWAFNFLNNCFIEEISAVKNYQEITKKRKGVMGPGKRQRFGFKEGENGITKNIQIKKTGACDCISCNYRNFDFDKILSKLKAAIGNEACNDFEYAYGNYIAATNNFKTSYITYKAIEKSLKGKENKGVEYFMAKKNIQLLHNLISDYQNTDSAEIMSDIKSVDLDKVIYDEIEFDVDNDVKNYLIKVKEDTLIYKIQDEIEEIVVSIDNLYHFYKKGGEQRAGPNLPQKLSHQYFLLYLHINRNYIIYDVFKRYRHLTEKVFKGLVTSYLTPKFNLLHFNNFFLTEAILHIQPTKLQEILSEVDSLKVDDKCVRSLLEKLNNYTNSTFKDSFWGGQPLDNSLLSEQLNNYKFKDRFTDIFANLFTVLSLLNITKEEFSKSVQPLLNFLKVEKDLAWHDMQEFSSFVNTKGDLFEVSDLMEILKIAIKNNEFSNVKYENLIPETAGAILKFYPEYKIDNIQLINTALSKCFSENGIHENYNHLIYLTKACDDKCKQALFTAFESYLDKKFNADFYENLLRNSDYNFETKNYFKLYSEKTNQQKGEFAYKFGSNRLTDVVFINYIIIVYKLKIDFNREELKLFTGLNDFETWLLNPNNFDYTKFEAHWLIDLVSHTVILNGINTNGAIEIAIEKSLQKEFNPTLAELKYKYFTSKA